MTVSIVGGGEHRFAPGLSGITAEIRASLFDMAAVANWADGDLETVLELLKKPSGSPKSESKRRAMQECLPALLSYFDATEWGMLNSPDLPRVDKVDILFRRLWALGVRNVAEPSFKFLNSVVLLLTD